MDAMQTAVAGLEKARLEAAREVARWQHKLSSLDDALKSLQHQVLVIDDDQLPKKQDFADLGIVEAAKRWLQEVGSATTGSIAEQLLARGLRTKSKRFVPTVYSTMQNSKLFKRVDGEWRLKEGGK